MSSACIRRHHQLPPLRLGADVEWVVAGSGSLSSGSAKSRAQIIAAQRLDPQPGAVSSPVTSTAAVVIPQVDGTSKSANLKGNPWTVRRAVVAADTKVIPPYNRSHSAGQKGSWSLYPIVGGKLPPDEQRPRGGGSPWTGDVQGAALASSTGSYRPLYLKFQNPPEGTTVERGFSVLPSKLAAVSISGATSQEKLNQTWPPPSTSHRVLTPTQHRGRRILEPLNNSNPGEGVRRGGRTKIHEDSSEEIIDLTKYRSRSRSEGVVERSPSKHGNRKSRNRAVKVVHDPVRAHSSPSIHVDSVSEDCTILQKPMLARQPIKHELSSSVHSDYNGRQSLFTPPAEPFLPAVEPSTPPTTPPVSDSQDELEFKSIDENDHVPQPLVEEEPSPIQQIFQTMEAEERAYKYQLLKEQENETAPSTSPPVEEKTSTTPEVNTLPGTPQKVEPEENNNGRKHAGSIIDLHLDVEDASINTNTVNSIKRPKRIKRTPATSRGPVKPVGGNRSQQPSLFSDSLGAVEKPREAMQQCFTQVNSAEWEVVIQGLQLLVRLSRYHPDTIHHHLHSVMVALGKQVRNLRSQVARAACQACGDLFVSQKRAIETDLDEVAAPLLHRSADTNRFLRADSNAALDKMVENISPSRAVSLIVSKGMRCLAKELFRLLSRHPSFSRTMNEVIPSQLLRNISKTLQNLK